MVQSAVIMVMWYLPKEAKPPHYPPRKLVSISGIITVTAISSSIRSAFTLLLHIPDHVDVEKIKIEVSHLSVNERSMYDT